MNVNKLLQDMAKILKDDPDGFKQIHQGMKEMKDLQLQGIKEINK